MILYITIAYFLTSPLSQNLTLNHTSKQKYYQDSGVYLQVSDLFLRDRKIKKKIAYV